MARSLVIAVWLHQGRYHGEDDQFDEFDGTGGWPPSPARLFQALVAAAARGASLLSEDERALRWLEELRPPRVVAVTGRRGSAVKLFVPSNDLDSKGGDPARAAEIRVAKHWCPVLFDSSQPVLYVWDLEAEVPESQRVCEVAAGLYQLGRGIDMAWATAQVVGECEVAALLDAHPGAVRIPGGAGETAVPRSGTLDSLVRRYVGRRHRLRTVGSGQAARQLLFQPPKALLGRSAYDAPPRRILLELRRPDGGFAPFPLTLAASLTSNLLARATARLQDSLPARSEQFERLVRGRGAGPADLRQRVRLLPTPSIGSSHADLSIRRVLLEVPADCPIGAADLRWAFAGSDAGDTEAGGASSGRLVPTNDSRMADRFVAPASSYRSVTPLALSTAPRRRIAGNGPRSVAERIREEDRAVHGVVQALRHAGVRSRAWSVRVQKEPFHRSGSMAGSFAKGSRFASHALWHAELEFDEAVAGPLVLGDGRFCGLGLLEPAIRPAGVVGFDLEDRCRVAPSDRLVLLRCLRRALMALAREADDRVGRLFSGHETDGAPGGSGHHSHVFLAADGGSGKAQAIRRLIVVAPWAADRRTRRAWSDVRKFDEVTHGLGELVAGRLGRFDHLMAQPVREGDPLVGPAYVWVGQTDYVASRNLKPRQDAAEIVRADVTAECLRRGLPAPSAVNVLSVASGPRGGRPTARLSLRFAVAVRGPLLLGRDSHVGGGLFHAAHEDE